MKRIFSMLAVVSLMAACNNDAATDDSTTPDSSSATSETMAPADTSSSAGTTMKDGVMAMRDGKMMVMTAGNWEPMKEAVTCTNGRKVMPNGEVSKGDKKRKMEEGTMIDKDGQMMDKDGKMMDNTGWE